VGEEGKADIGANPFGWLGQFSLWLGRGQGGRQ